MIIFSIFLAIFFLWVYIIPAIITWASQNLLITGIIAILAIVGIVLYLIYVGRKSQQTPQYQVTHNDGPIWRPLRTSENSMNLPKDLVNGIYQLLMNPPSHLVLFLSVIIFAMIFNLPPFTGLPFITRFVVSLLFLPFLISYAIHHPGWVIIFFTPILVILYNYIDFGHGDMLFVSRPLSVYTISIGIPIFCFIFGIPWLLAIILVSRDLSQQTPQDQVTQNDWPITRPPEISVRRHFSRRQKREAVERQEGKCDHCGKTTHFSHRVFHHKNYNHSDNSDENCVMLCANCSNEIHRGDYEV